MKKLTTKLVSLILAMAFVVSICSACDLVTTNTDRNMSQVIATVKISDKVDGDDILKKELNSGYLSYGFQYVQYYGYSQSKAYQTVLDNLVSNRIIMQQSRIELANTYNSLLTKTEGLTEFETYFKANALAKGEQINPKSGDIDNLKKYLTAYEVANAEYQIRKNVNDLIKSYEEEKDEEKDETIDVLVPARQAPAVKEKEELTEEEKKSQAPDEDEQKIAEVVIGATAFDKTNVYDLDMAVFAEYKIDVSTNARKKAFSKLLSFLKDNGLITSTETQDISTPDNILKYSYFVDMLTTQLENTIVEKYENSLQASVEAKLTSDGLWNEYVNEYNNQKALYKNDITAYETALSGVSDTSFVLYNPHQNYSYVLNLLIPFSEEQEVRLSEKKAEKGISKEDVELFRSTLASNIVAKDQRESWVYSSKGKYNKDSKSFTFDSDYRTSDVESLKDFIGEVVVKSGLEDGVTKKDDNQVDQTTWYFQNAVATELSMADLFANYVTPATGIEAKYFVSGDEMTIGQITYSKDIFDKFNDLMYTFGTDAGALGKYYGYLYSPYTHTYVKEFEEACKMVTAKGVGAYTTVLTDFGYHVILCTNVVSTTYDDSAESKSAFIADLETEDTLAYNYRENKLNSIVSSEISKVANKLINEYKDDADKVTYFKDTYKDLITEEETAE